MERPILFSGPLVRAILAGEKTVTRRLVRFRKNGVESVYAQPGDILWVREAWCLLLEEPGERPVEPEVVIYAATVNEDWPGLEAKWRPSIFMRKEHSRIKLRVLRVEKTRLQDITEDDVAREGITGGVSRFAGGWDEINGHRSGAMWCHNPWVWRVEFEVAEVKLRPREVQKPVDHITMTFTEGIRNDEP